MTIKKKITQEEAESWLNGTLIPMDLQNLKFDPAVEAMKPSQDVETEEEGVYYEALRRLKVQQLSIGQTKKREKKNG